MLEFIVNTAVAADHPCFAGHFPQQPVVPAVLLLELAAEALRGQLGAVRINGVPNAKFLRPMLPDQAFSLRLRADTSRGRAIFRCDSGGLLTAQGELTFDCL